MCLSLCTGYSRKPVSADDIDEGLRLGDYPVLPWQSAQELRPKGWWDDQDRRDKETPVGGWVYHTRSSAWLKGETLLYFFTTRRVQLVRCT